MRMDNELAKIAGVSHDTVAVVDISRLIMQYVKQRRYPQKVDDAIKG